MQRNQNDILNRRQKAKQIATLLHARDDLFPFLIDGAWGEGKTHFVHQVTDQLPEKAQYLYIDCFEHDYYDNARATILAEIINTIAPNQELRQGLMKKAGKVIGLSLKTGGKAIVRHILKADEVSLGEEFEKAIEETSAEAIDASSQAMLSSFLEAKEEIKALRLLINTALSDNQQLIVFLDELDRCRPNFALSVLEVVKHIFNTPTIKFVIVANAAQLKSSISHHYGYAIESEDYLRKFYTSSFVIPKKDKDGHACIRYLQTRLKESSINSTNDGIKWSVLPALVEEGNLSLRQVDSLIKSIEISNIYSNLPIDFQARTPVATTLSIISAYLSCIKQLDPNTPSLENDIRAIYGDLLELKIEKVKEAIHRDSYIALFTAIELVKFRNEYQSGFECFSAAQTITMDSPPNKQLGSTYRTADTYESYFSGDGKCPIALTLEIVRGLHNFSGI